MSTRLSEELRLYRAAESFLGVREVPGLRSNPYIQGWIYSAAQWLNPDDSKTAWCGCFRAALADITGTQIVPAAFRALSWTSYGRSIRKVCPAKWPRGATVILKRKGGYHVGLLHAAAPGEVYILGGNQSDSVSIALYAESAVLDVRVSLDSEELRKHYGASL